MPDGFLMSDGAAAFEGVGPMPDEQTDLRREVRRLLQARANTLPGHRADNEQVLAIARSHYRSARKGLDPDRGAGVRILSAAQLERRRRESGLAGLIPDLRMIAERGDRWQLTTVHDLDGWVLWRFGAAETLHLGDSFGLIEGACWREDAVGTTAAGTAAILGGGLLCIDREHYVASHHGFTCAATPLFDGWDRSLRGVFNATTLASMTHRNTLVMVELAARSAEERARNADDLKLRAMGEAAGRTLSRFETPAVLTDHRGRVAASHRITLKHQVLQLPTQVSNQPFVYPRLGGCWVVEPFSTGLLLWRPASADHTPPPTRVELDVHQPTRWSLTVHGDGTSTEYNLTKKHAEIFFLLAWTPAGRTSAELGQDLYGGFAARSTVRALLCRVQKEFGPMFDSEPYRFKDHLEVKVSIPGNLGELLPFSSAPAICRIRVAQSADVNPGRI
ncbi:MAG: hypothetical protein M3Y48_01945 [Actinomycetota bacterium]|nr:hypothetical protein [Actinomycetota bacterium]